MQKSTKRLNLNNKSTFIRFHTNLNVQLLKIHAMKGEIIDQKIAGILNKIAEYRSRDFHSLYKNLFFYPPIYNRILPSDLKHILNTLKSFGLIQERERKFYITNLGTQYIQKLQVGAI